MRGFVRYAIIIYQNWTMYKYIALVIKDSTTYILYKSPHICEELYGPTLVWKSKYPATAKPPVAFIAG